MAKTMLIYEDVAALSREQHQNLKLQPIKNFTFASDLHWSPVAGPEFVLAARDYPIVFIRENADATISPVLLLGFDTGYNCYLDEAGGWRKDTYIPAFIRRYPFILAETGKDDEVTVCFDALCPDLSESEGVPLFDEDAANSALLDNAIRFMNDYRAGMHTTAEFVSLLERFDLFEETSFDIRASDGTALNLQNILIVSEAKFAKAFGSQLAQLNASGFLMWVLAHQMSLINLPRLLDLQVARRMETPKQSKDATPSASQSLEETVQ